MILGVPRFVRGNWDNGRKKVDILNRSQAAQNSPQELEIGSKLLLSLLTNRWALTHHRTT